VASGAAVFTDCGAACAQGRRRQGHQPSSTDLLPATLALIGMAGRDPRQGAVELAQLVARALLEPVDDFVVFALHRLFGKVRLQRGVTTSLVELQAIQLIHHDPALCLQQEASLLMILHV